MLLHGLREGNIASCLVLICIIRRQEISQTIPHLDMHRLTIGVNTRRPGRQIQMLAIGGHPCQLHIWFVIHNLRSGLWIDHLMFVVFGRRHEILHVMTMINHIGWKTHCPCFFSDDRCQILVHPAIGEHLFDALSQTLFVPDFIDNHMRLNLACLVIRVGALTKIRTKDNAPMWIDTFTNTLDLFVRQHVAGISIRLSVMILPTLIHQCGVQTFHIAGEHNVIVCAHSLT